MSALTILPIRALRDNYIWCIQQSGKAIVIDPAESAPVRAYLAQHSLQLVAILLTHRHADHVGGASELAAAGCPVYGPASIAAVTHPVNDGNRLQLADLPLAVEVLALPGHTSEHLGYRLGDACFCGDTLFGAGCGRVFDGEPAALYRSLQRLAALPLQTQFYPAHEYTLANLAFAAAAEADNPAIAQRQAAVSRQLASGQPSLPVTLCDELATNPFLRDTPSLRASATKALGRPIGTAQDLFIALREWKNHF